MLTVPVNTDSPIQNYTSPKDRIIIPVTYDMTPRLKPFTAIIYCYTYRTRESEKSLVWVVIDVERF